MHSLHQTWRVLRACFRTPTGLVLVACAVVWGCQLAAEKIGGSTEPLTWGTVGTDEADAGGQPTRHEELSAAWSPSGGSGAATLVAGYNINNPT